MSPFAELSHPEHRVEVEEELVQLARNIRAWQEGQSPRISDEQMLRRYPGLGSTKTYRRLRDADTDGLVCENHLPKYRGAWGQIEEASGAAGDEPVYEDLTPTLECSVAVAGLIPQRGRTRLVLIEGPTGSGKTFALRVVAQKYAGSVAVTEAHEGWGSLNRALGDIAVALGCAEDNLPASVGDRLALCIATANRARKVLLIDEGHHCTAAVLNALKTFLNRTDSLAVIACIDTLWRKLTARSWEEARQLIHNRLYERVRLAPPSAADAATYLSRRMPALKASGDWKPAAAKVAAMSAHLGHYAFLRRVAEKLAAQPDEADGAAMLAAATAIKACLETR